MSLESVKIILCIVISSTVCQYTQSQLMYPDLVYAESRNVTYNDPRDVISFRTHNDKLVTKIVGGSYAKLGDFPYMAVVHQLLGNGVVGQCGGTIISERWVLTAGHCVVKFPRRFLVVFGVVDKSNIEYDSLRGPGVSMIVTQAYVHPQYVQNVDNDVALLFMPQDIPFSRTIQPIKLSSYLNDKSLANRNAHVIGWGKDHMFSKGTKRLKYATLPILENNKCKQYWKVSNKHICTAAGLGRDACQGDSGGPLVVIENGQDLQIGIVSYGDAFCPSNSPGVFTRVSEFINWIYQTMDDTIYGMDR